jgi:hypothetical protein
VTEAMIREDGENQEKIKNLMQAIQREEKKLMQKGSQADSNSKGKGKTRK